MQQKTIQTYQNVFSAFEPWRYHPRPSHGWQFGRRPSYGGILLEILWEFFKTTRPFFVDCEDLFVFFWGGSRGENLTFRNWLNSCSKTLPKIVRGNYFCWIQAKGCHSTFMPAQFCNPFPVCPWRKQGSPNQELQSKNYGSGLLDSSWFLPTS